MWKRCCMYLLISIISTIASAWGCGNEIKLSGQLSIVEIQGLTLGIQFNIFIQFLLCFCFNNAALSSCVEQVRELKMLWGTNRMTTCQWSSYHIVADLGFGVDDSLLGTYQTIQTRHGGACGRRRSTVNNGRAAQTNEQTGVVVLMVDSCTQISSPTTVASVSLVCWWQQSPFFHSAQCEQCEANMTLTLHLLQRPSQSGVLHLAEISP